MASPRRHITALVGVALLGLLGVPAAARAELGSLGALSIGLGVSGGIQIDGRGCNTAGSSRTVPGTGTCVLWAGGLDVSLLFRGHIGGTLGLWSVAGQAAELAQGQSGPAFPDRISVPLMLDVRPLSFLPDSANPGSLSRFLHGLRLGLGPSLEFVRTSSDSSLAWGQRLGETARSLIGMHASLDLEAPLQATAHGLSLRFSTRVLYAPVIVLNDALISSAPVASDQPAAELATTFQGYAAHVQVYLGVVYYL